MAGRAWIHSGSPRKQKEALPWGPQHGPIPQWWSHSTRTIKKSLVSTRSTAWLLPWWWTRCWWGTQSCKGDKSNASEAKILKDDKQVPRLKGGSCPSAQKEQEKLQGEALWELSQEDFVCLHVSVCLCVWGKVHPMRTPAHPLNCELSESKARFAPISSLTGSQEYRKCSVSAQWRHDYIQEMQRCRIGEDNLGRHLTEQCFSHLKDCLTVFLKVNFTQWQVTVNVCFILQYIP